MFTERCAIEQRMREIREERRDLQQEYYKLMDRLRELDDGYFCTSPRKGGIRV
ncbi:hypothetical protein [Ammoniphilus sp. YIM 78166]|uniref:hypothetical protein n=1 Tax=Ammoniphilus sp. YIM 78166 TaxID=1644106 RepID=UPI0014315EFD|nr:hypothetical protein [Ammoniphilus sp. YIM 78166]